MKPLKYILLAVALVILPLQKANAQYIVSDVKAEAALAKISGCTAAQATQMVKDAEQAYTTYQTLEKIRTAIGTGSWQSMDLGQLDAMVSSLPGMSGFNLNTLFPQSGYLDIFMGMSPAQFTQTVSNPSMLASSALMNRALGQIGAASSANGGPNAAALQWAARLATSPTGTGSVGDATNFMAAYALSNQQNNANRLAALSKASQQNSTAAAGAKDANSKLGAGNNATAINTQVTIEAARQQGETNAALTGQAIQQTTLLDAGTNRSEAESKYEH